MILCLPFLMFQGQAQEAIDLYLDTFPDAELLEVMHHPEGTELLDPSAAGDASTLLAADTAALETVVDWDTTLVATAQLRIGGQLLMIQDSLVRHAFDFTPSISVAVVVDTATEFTHITDRLAEGGEFLMEPGDYDFAENFAWVKDRFGVTWQINQPTASSEEEPDTEGTTSHQDAPLNPESPASSGEQNSVSGSTPRG